MLASRLRVARASDRSMHRRWGVGGGEPARWWPACGGAACCRWTRNELIDEEMKGDIDGKWRLAVGYICKGMSGLGDKSEGGEQWQVEVD